MSSIAVSKFGETVTEHKMTEGKVTELRMTEGRITEGRKGPKVD